MDQVKEKGLFENIDVIVGPTGSGKSHFLKNTKIPELISNQNRLFVFDRYSEYGMFSKNEAIELVRERDKGSFFDKLSDIYNQAGSLSSSTSTFIIIEDFSQYCRSEYDQLKFLKIADQMRSYGCYFVLVLMNWESIHKIPRLLLRNFHYQRE